MAQFKIKIQHLLLVLFAASVNSHRQQVNSVLHLNTPTSFIEPHTISVTTVAKSTLVSTAIVRDHNNSNKVMSFQSAITTSVSQNTHTRVFSNPTAGADAVRAVAPSREWISTILDTVVMTLLGLASIVVAVILGRRQLRAMGVQLQLMLDIAQGHPDSNHVAMNDLERGQHVSDPDGDRIEARSEISSVDPAEQRADPSNGFLPEPQPHVVGDDLQAQLVRYDEPAGIRPERPTCGDNFPNDEIEQREDEGQTLEDTSAGSSCSHLGRQDSNDLNLDGPKALHLDDRESHLVMIAGISTH
jgi:hypothetical protein